MGQNQFNNVVDSLLKGMGTLLTTHTVVGEPARVGDTIIVPLVDVSFGVGAGSGSGKMKDTGSGGFGAKMSPSAVLMIQNGHTKLINIKNQDAVTKILDIVPDVVNRFTGKGVQFDEDEAVDIAFGDKEDADRNAGGDAS
ncbi:MAG: GerW family sporulation protein [Lachnospiraceae bacterium]|nr:GerW family sporulation protein [Lachnospiraceae bacterium]